MGDPFQLTFSANKPLSPTGEIHPIDRLIYKAETTFANLFTRVSVSLPGGC